jgi:hypothetical protein
MLANTCHYRLLNKQKAIQSLVLVAKGLSSRLAAELVSPNARKASRAMRLAHLSGRAGNPRFLFFYA